MDSDGVSKAQEIQVERDAKQDAALLRRVGEARGGVGPGGGDPRGSRGAGMRGDLTRVEKASC